MLRYCGRKRGVSVRLPVGQAPPALYFSMAAGGRAFCSLALCSWEAQRTSSPLAPASPPSPATSLEPRAGRRLHELLTSSRVPSLTILQRGQPGGRLTSGDRDDDRPLLVSAEDVPADVPTHQLSVSSSQPPLHPLSLPRPGSPPKNTQCFYWAFLLLCPPSQSLLSQQGPEKACGQPDKPRPTRLATPSP